MHALSLTRWPLARSPCMLSPTHAHSPARPQLKACPEHVGALGNVEEDASIKLMTRLSAREVVRLTGGWVGGCVCQMCVEIACLHVPIVRLYPCGKWYASMPCLYAHLERHDPPALVCVRAGLRRAYVRAFQGGGDCVCV